MSPDSIQASFPSVCARLQKSQLDEDISAATAFAEEGEKSLREAMEAEEESYIEFNEKDSGEVAIRGWHGRDEGG